MKWVVTFLGVFLLSIPVWAWGPISESDLSTVTLQDDDSLIINPDMMTLFDIKRNEMDDSNDFKNFRELSKDSNDLGNPPLETHDLAYPKGHTGSANENGPNVVDLPIRTYSTGRADFYIKPGSWVDHTVK